MALNYYGFELLCHKFLNSQIQCTDIQLEYTIEDRIIKYEKMQANNIMPTEDIWTDGDPLTISWNFF